jgi:hypothetical protein
MLEILKNNLKKFPAGFYVTVVGLVGILSIVSLRQSHEKKKQAAFLTLFNEYEKKATPELLEQLLSKTSSSSHLKKRFGGRLLQEMVLFRPDIFTKAWLKDPIKVKDSYDKFSEGSLLIVENKYEDALMQSESLQKEISLENSPALFAFNTFRLAVLHDKLGHGIEAKKHFESIMEQKVLKETLNEAYKYESVSVADYISERISSLIADK